MRIPLAALLAVLGLLIVSIDWSHVSGPSKGWTCDEKTCVGEWYIEIPFQLAPKEYQARKALEKK